MSMRNTDPILGPSRGGVNEAIAALDRPDETDREFLAALYEWAGIAGVDWSVACAQAFHETARLTSPRWLRDRNPAGIGIPAGDTPQPFPIPDGDAAARLQIQCLYALVNRQLHLEVPLWPLADRWVREVWLGRHILDPAFPGVRVVGDLNKRYRDRTGDMQATWAWDDQYTAKLLRTSNAVFPELPDFEHPGSETTNPSPSTTTTKESTMKLTFGQVPFPKYRDRPITKTAGFGMDNLGKRDVIGVTYHRMLGSLEGTYNHFRNPATAALTDCGIGVSATDGAALDGVIDMYNDPLGFQSGWASGKVIAPWGDGLAFVNKYGANAVNKRRFSIEISGNYDTPISGKVKEQIAALSAYWADQDGIPWDVYPIRPGDGFSFVCWHQEFTGPQEKVCPGQVVMDATPEIIELTRDIMKRHQTAEAPATGTGTSDSKPITYPWLTDPNELAKGLDRTSGSTRFYAFRRLWTAKRDTPRYRDSSGTTVIGPEIKAGETFVGEFVYLADNGWWVLTRYGTRVRVADLDLQIDLEAA